MTQPSTERGKAHMTDAKTLLALAARCETEEPSAALDIAIAVAINLTHARPFGISLDAAVTLEPKDAREIVIRKYPNGCMYVRITTAKHGVVYCEAFNRPIGEPMARVAAALRARAALEGQI